MRIWIKNPLAIYAENAKGGVVIQDDKIIELVSTDQKPTLAIDHVIDATQHVVLPGLINTHHHYYQTLFRAYRKSLNLELFPWLKALYKAWAKLTPESFVSACKIAQCELLLSGCTTSADHHYIFTPTLKNAIDIQAKVAQELQCRAIILRGSMDLSEKDGGLPPDEVVQTLDEILSDSERVINRYHDPNPGSLLQIALAPCSPFSVTKEVMVESAKLAKKMHVRLHTHLSETEDENKFCLKKYGMRPLDYLEECGWLHDQTWLAHAIHYTDEELVRLGEHHVGMSHCPSSNMILASGMFRGIDAENRGCRVSIAVDGSSSNDHSNMMLELRQAFLLQRLQYGSKLSAMDIFRWGTKRRRRCIRQE